MDMQQRKKVGILGGTFDPIHMGHLILAENAYNTFSLDYVWIMPNGNPPHKPGMVSASMQQRIRMIELAVADNEHLQVSDFEKTSGSYHYTYETLEFLKKKYPDTDYYFILGADSLLQFSTWKEPERICQCCTILAATRDHMETKTLLQHMQYLKDTYGARIQLLETPNMDISSQLIREKVRKQQTIRYYVPDTVEAYIREQGLYRSM